MFIHQVLKADPLNGRMEIRAYAGPMNHEKAIVFRKKWKTPPRMPRTPNQNACRQAYRGSLSCHAFRLLDVEKGLERVGRWEIRTTSSLCFFHFALVRHCLPKSKWFLKSELQI